MSVPTAITVNITVNNLSQILQIFDKIQVYRSITGIGGSYSEITANTPSAAL